MAQPDKIVGPPLTALRPPLPPRRGGPPVLIKVGEGRPWAEGPKRLISISIKNRLDKTGTHPKELPSFPAERLLSAAG